MTRFDLYLDYSVPLGRKRKLMKKGKQEIIKIGETAKDYRKRMDMVD